ncbi:unnamed protein product [Caenorhabditis auriculariae]|uniref:DUF19 domain-containing protein n=1 Tax=Caenorhabditis auriculariae TaxID=2777116 RepID=A0A8S1GZD2_9PELO|nr:unnamed protein product [Caenorhabditis auriculariae]
MTSALMFLMFFLVVWSSTGRRWTEEDEDRRIQDINDQERKMFENEMRAQEYTRLGYKPTYEKPQQLYSSNVKSRKYFQPADPLPDPLRSPEPEEPQQNEKFWCYHCASPINKVSTDLRKAVRNFLELRRTTYPQEAVTPECVSAKNFSALLKQQCNYHYCQTLSLVDHNEGASFVIRGCAENFGAINTQVMDSRPDYSCNKLHDKMDIRECICKDSQYCHAGRRTRNSDSNSKKASILIFSLFTLTILL